MQPVYFAKCSFFLVQLLPFEITSHITKKQFQLSILLITCWSVSQKSPQQAQKCPSWSSRWPTRWFWWVLWFFLLYSCKLCSLLLCRCFSASKKNYVDTSITLTMSYLFSWTRIHFIFQAGDQMLPVSWSKPPSKSVKGGEDCRIWLQLHNLF